MEIVKQIDEIAADYRNKAIALSLTASMIEVNEVSEKSIYNSIAFFIKQAVAGNFPSFSGDLTEGWMTVADGLEERAESSNGDSVISDLSFRVHPRILKNDLKSIERTFQTLVKNQQTDMEKDSSGELTVAERVKVLHFTLRHITYLFRPQLKAHGYYDIFTEAVDDLRQLFLRMGEPSLDRTRADGGTGSGFSWTRQ